MKSIIAGAFAAMFILISVAIPGSAQTNPALLRPANLKEAAPATFKADFQLGNGAHFVVEVHRDWAPFGADRFYNPITW
jgi:peptidyl-prolyl cis-trans isomerase A (cyclophilin A)